MPPLTITCIPVTLLLYAEAATLPLAYASRHMKIRHARRYYCHYYIGSDERCLFSLLRHCRHTAIATLVDNTRASYDATVIREKAVAGRRRHYAAA